MEWLWLILMGFGTGAYGILIGAGGGFMLGPLLLVFMDLEPEVMAGTVLASVAISSISGAIAYRRMRVIDYRSGLLFAAAAIPGSVLGALGVGSVPPNTFRILFGVLLLVLALLLAVRPGLPDSAATETPKHIVTKSVRTRRIRTSDGVDYRYEFNELLATSLNIFLGFISSFFGTGGGFLRTPVLISAFGFPVRIAVATSVFALAFYTTVGAATHATLGHVEWYPTFLFSGIGLVVGGQVGAQLSRWVKGPWIMRLLLIVVLILGIRLIVEGIQG
ncbi:MAG: sulfite exporter TauE/SafE family protein [SAR202 cluster bacterium]|nr:sulfite exporter TauE/SafE family protein [SAR202 cluster bacterium]